MRLDEYLAWRMTHALLALGLLSYHSSARHSQTENFLEIELVPSFCWRTREKIIQNPCLWEQAVPKGTQAPLVSPNRLPKLRNPEAAALRGPKPSQTDALGDDDSDEERRPASSDNDAREQFGGVESGFFSPSSSPTYIYCI